MKAFILGIITLTAFSNTTFAQQKVAQKAVIQTPGVQDEVCKTRIETYLKREDGVASVRADYRRHTVTVVWYTDRTNIENIKTALANLGFDADDVKADPDAVKRLPPACQPKVVNKDAVKAKK